MPGFLPGLIVEGCLCVGVYMEQEEEGLVESYPRRRDYSRVVHVELRWGFHTEMMMGRMM